MTRRVLIPLMITLTALGVISSACTQQQKALFLSLPKDQQIAVANHLSSSQSGGSCHSAVRSVWPSHLWGWADKIVSRESGGSPTAQNRSSSAAGCFQIIKGTWNANAACSWSARYDAMCNAKTAWTLYQRAGTSPWKLTNY